MGQKQQLEMERAETDKALEELQKAGESDNVYKFSGTIMIKSTKQNLITELEEKKLMDQTRSTVLEKQEERVKTSLKEQETKITEMMKGSQPGNESPQGTSDTDNPRR